MIKAIMACDERGGVGHKGGIPWPHIPRDMQWFLNHTEGDVMVMGSATWKDPQLAHPMPQRTSYVVTTRPHLCPRAHGHIQGNIVERIQQLAEQHAPTQLWIIGGPRLIEQCLNIIDLFYLSRIPGVYECDRFLPINQLNSWNIQWQEKHPDVLFQILERP